MEAKHIAEAASLLAAAWRTRTRIDGLPEACRPRSVDEAHAIQDAATAALGMEVRAFKANAPVAGDPGTPGLRAPIYAPVVRPTPARVPVAEGPQCGVEAEVAFRFRHDLPPRATAYTRDEVAAAVDACAAIEVVSSRFTEPDKMTALDRLADAINNSGFVHGPTIADWQALDLGRIKVRLTVNGETVVEKAGGHPIGDPLAVAVTLVELMRMGGGVKSGQFVTCGSYTGLRYIKPGDTCGASFEGLGAAELQFIP